MSILINRQRSIARTGAIRMGEIRSTSGNKTYPAQRETFRFTSANKAALEMLAATYGGQVKPWKDHPGEFEVCSNSNQLSVLIDTTLSVDEQFDQYDGQTCTHKCDGVNCHFVELKRENKKIVFCEDRGIVQCQCDPDGLGEDLDDEDRKCDLKTYLRVILPATGDIILWQFTSKGKIFNREVFGAIDALRSMGVRQGYCHLTIHIVKKVRGEEVTRFGVARLTLDPQPPNFVAMILANTPEAQARELLEGTNLAPSLGAPAQKVITASTAPQLPTPNQPSAMAPTQAQKALAYMQSFEFTVDDMNRFEEWKKDCTSKEVSWAKAVLEASEKVTTPGNVDEFLRALGVVDAGVLI